MAQATSFVEEINYNEIEILEVVGKGSFGVVNKGRWRNMYVAVKMISGESEKKAFVVEVRQLSRVNHPNIVRLYGACTSKPVCLVMEYAEGGSLYNVLHGNPQPEYSASHAMSWALQCAQGVSYLHNMKPKALIHRDLKPPNLLLVNGGTVLKICDFGTACDIHTHMTNNKGSAAWMAPEVFEGSNYSEKCDVFSWGIILWEVISRRKPFDDSGSAYRILWAVHSGKRPPLIRNCPKPLEILMTRCWAEKPECRPSMDEVVSIMAHIFSFFKGSDEPIKYPLPSEAQEEIDEDVSDSYSDEGVCYSEATQNPEVTPEVTEENSSGSDATDMSRNFVTNVENVGTISQLVTVKEATEQLSKISMTSAPASLAGSKEDLNSEADKTIGTDNAADAQANRYTDGNLIRKNSKHRGHQRSGSYGSSFVVQPTAVPAISPVDGFSGNFSGNNAKEVLFEQASGFRNVAPAWTSTTSRKQSWPQDQVPTHLIIPQEYLQPSPETVNSAYHLLDSYLQPLTPYHGSWESMQIFEEHKKMAYKYLRVQTELALLMQRKMELVGLLKEQNMDACDIQQNGSAIMNDYDKLTKEKENLKQLHANLKEQLVIISTKQEQQ